MKAQVKDRYYALAAANISHFSAGGTARNSYEVGHQQALASAFIAGASGDAARWSEAMMQEAFCNHYLSDMFSAGHVRTPRAAIKTWYSEHFPNSVPQFITYMAHWMTSYLDRIGDIPWYCPNPRIEAGIRAQIRELGGSAVDSFSLGDIVSLALHDKDNEGLNVVSDADPVGNLPGGFKWRAVGDAHLRDASPESRGTQEMVTAAMRASLAELSIIRDSGQVAAHGVCLSPEELDSATANAIAALQPFSAKSSFRARMPTAETSP